LGRENKKLENLINMKNKNMILVAVLVLLVGGGAFGTGYKVGQLKSRVNFTGRFEDIRNTGGIRNGTGTGMGQKLGGGRGQITGEITALDDKTMTVKMTDGSSKIILMADAMMVNKSVAGSKTDLAVGGKIAVFGATNSDGSVTASSVELDPKFLGQTAVPTK
jgi:hypothetical protein